MPVLRKEFYFLVKPPPTDSLTKVCKGKTGAIIWHGNCFVMINLFYEICTLFFDCFYGIDYSGGL